MASVLEDLAATALAAGPAVPAAARAARLLGAPQAIREVIGTVLAPCERPQHDRSAAAARTVLGFYTDSAGDTDGLLALPRR